ncbi:unnamed protein product, partial [Closterium sp. NIES-54]
SQFPSLFLHASLVVGINTTEYNMAPLWLTPQQYLMNRPRALSLYRNLLREIGKRPGGMSWAAAESRRRDVRMLFEMGRSEASVNNLRELFRTGEHVLAQLRRGHLPQVAYV